ncbi:MAG: uroporphyrinogen-III synthase [Planctomycetota bacterium]
MLPKGIHMSDPRHTKRGRVYIVGAGPGAPGLITVRGAECLQQADVVFHEASVNPKILRHVREDAKRICVDAPSGAGGWTQSEVARRTVELARAGEAVVHLDAGDSIMFGRHSGGMDSLAEHGIKFEIVPGVPIASVAASHAGVPLTRGSGAVALVTGHRGGGNPPAEPDYARLAHFPGSLAISMDATDVEHWARNLIRGGLPSQTPACVIRDCSLPTQRTTGCTVGQLEEHLSGVGPGRLPVLVVVGQDAAHRSTANWFETRPLFGQTVLVTRPAGQVKTLASKLEEHGAHVLAQPAIEVREPADWGAADDAISRLSDFHWLVFSSVNGVNAFMSRLRATGRDLRALGTAKLAAIGPATAAALGNYHLKVDRCPRRYQAEYLAEALLDDAAGKRFLLVRASRGREWLAQQLTTAGADVEQVVFYESVDSSAASPRIRAALAAEDIRWTTVTSSAIARSLARMFGSDLKKTNLVSISPLTSSTLHQLGFEPTVEAPESTMDGVVQAIVDFAMSQKP